MIVVPGDEQTSHRRLRPQTEVAVVADAATRKGRRALICLLGLCPLASCAHPLPRACQDTEQHLDDLRERCRKDDADLQRCVDELASGPARRMAESAAGLGAGAEADDVLAEIGRLKDRLALQADARPTTGVQK